MGKYMPISRGGSEAYKAINFVRVFQQQGVYSPFLPVAPGQVKRGGMEGKPVKQRISAEDLAELTPEQQERLREWWRPENGDMSLSPQGVPKVYVGDITQKDRNTPLLSIGQCIELLKDKTNEQSFGYNDSGCFWTVNVGNRGVGNMIEGCAGKQFSTAELIDALFATVKEVL